MRTAHLPEFKQVSQTAKRRGTQWTHVSLHHKTGPSSAEKCKVCFLYPETVIPTELHSEKENEFEGLSMTLILPNTTLLDRIQYTQTNTKQINNLFTKGKTKSTILFGFCLLSFDNGSPACRLPLFSLVILWDPSLPSWIPITVQLHGCPCSATHASGTTNRAPASCLWSWAIEKPTTRLDSWGGEQIGDYSGGQSEGVFVCVCFCF